MRTPYKGLVPRVTSGFRLADRPDHNGLDTKAGECGTLDGTIVHCPITQATVVLASKGYNYGRGNKVLLCWYDDNANKCWLTVQHLAAIFVKAGQVVVEGQALGLEGWTGNVDPPNSNGTHTHWEYNVGGVLQSYGEVKGGALFDPAPLLCIKNLKGVYPIAGWQDKVFWVLVEYASIGDRKLLKEYCDNADIEYSEGDYNGPVVAPEGNELKEVRMGYMTKGDLDHILTMCQDGDLTAIVTQ